VSDFEKFCNFYICFPIRCSNINPVGTSWSLLPNTDSTVWFKSL